MTDIIAQMAKEDRQAQITKIKRPLSHTDSYAEKEQIKASRKYAKQLRQQHNLPPLTKQQKQVIEKLRHKNTDWKDMEVTAYYKVDSKNGRISPHTPTRFQQQSLEYKQILDQIYDLFIRKGKDYGCAQDHFDNIRSSTRGWLPANYPSWVGALIRQGDKLIRIQNFLKNGKLENESVEDSLRDNAVYALNALAMYLEDKNQK